MMVLIKMPSKISGPMLRNILSRPWTIVALDSLAFSFEMPPNPTLRPRRACWTWGPCPGNWGLSSLDQTTRDQSIRIWFYKIL